MLIKKASKKGVLEEGLVNLLLWIVFIIIIGLALYFFFKMMTSS